MMSSRDNAQLYKEKLHKDQNIDKQTKNEKQEQTNNEQLCKQKQMTLESKSTAQEAQFVTQLESKWNKSTLSMDVDGIPGCNHLERPAISSALSVLVNADPHTNFIVVEGPSGSGKSFLLKQLLDGRRGVLYNSLYKRYGILNSSEIGSLNELENALKGYRKNHRIEKDRPVLVLDDAHIRLHSEDVEDRKAMNYLLGWALQMCIEGLLNVVIVSNEPIFREVSQLSGARTRIKQLQIDYPTNGELRQVLSPICTEAEMNLLLQNIGGDLIALRDCVSDLHPLPKPTNTTLLHAQVDGIYSFLHTSLQILWILACLDDSSTFNANQPDVVKNPIV